MADQQVPVVGNLPGAPPLPIIDLHKLDFNSKEPIGEGTFAKIYSVFGTNPKTHIVENMAFKERKQGEHARLQLKQEVDILSQMSDEHVVEFLANVKDVVDPTCRAFLMEYLQLGSAFKFYTGRAGQDMLIDKETRISLCHDLIRGVNYVHRTASVHGDISCNNVMVGWRTDGNLIAKLGDFGSAFKIVDGYRFLTGTPCYVAEEVFCKRDCTQKSDVFSVACTCWFLKYGRHVLPGLPDAANNALHGGARYGMRPFARRSRPAWNMDDPLEEILCRAMNHQPEERPTMEVILRTISPNE